MLQHPHEVKRRLATVPLLSAALERVDVPRGRRFDGERCPAALLEAMEEAAEKKIPVLLMFPGPGALDVKDVAERGIPRSVVEGEGEEGEGEEEEGGGGGRKETTTATAAEAEEQQQTLPLAFGPVRGGEYILVAVDGTWHQGKQMFRVSLLFIWFAFRFSFLSFVEKKKIRLSTLIFSFFFLSYLPSLSSSHSSRTWPPGSWPLGARPSGSSSPSATPRRNSARRPLQPWPAPKRSGERQQQQQQQQQRATAAATKTLQRQKALLLPPTSRATFAPTPGRSRCSRSRSKGA